MKTKELKTCPECGEETLEFSQNADIGFKINENGSITPILDMYSIGWLDSTSLYCSSCGASDDDNNEINKRKKIIEDRQ